MGKLEYSKIYVTLCGLHVDLNQIVLLPSHEEASTSGNLTTREAVASYFLSFRLLGSMSTTCGSAMNSSTARSEELLDGDCDDHDAVTSSEVCDSCTQSLNESDVCSSFLLDYRSKQSLRFRQGPRGLQFRCGYSIWLTLFLMACGLCDTTLAAAPASSSSNPDNSWWNSDSYANPDKGDSDYERSNDSWDNNPPRNPLNEGEDEDVDEQDLQNDSRPRSTDMFPRRPNASNNTPFQRPPPPPPPSSNLSRNNNNRPPPTRTAQEQDTNSYIPIDYSFPNKDLVQPAKKTKRSLFGWGKNKKKDDDEDSEDSLPETANKEDEDDKPKDDSRPDDDDDWFDIPGNKRKGDFDNENEEKGDRPWVDADLRGSSNRRREDGGPSKTSAARARRPRPGDFASARRDAVARYMATSVRHRFTVYFWASAAGAALGAYLGKALLGNPTACASFLATIFGLLSAWARNPYGEWARAVGLGLWWTLMRSRRVRREYPTQRHVRALLGMGPRQRFPPHTDNPWSYKAADYETDNGRPPVEFEMWSALLCMVLVGSMAGGAVPIIPSWMGALGGAASLAILTTRKDSRGGEFLFLKWMELRGRITIK